MLKHTVFKDKLKYICGRTLLWKLQTMMKDITDPINVKFYCGFELESSGLLRC